MKNIKLNNSLTIIQIHDIYDQISNQLKEKKSIKIDCSDLEKIDAAGIQMFISLLKTAKEKKEDISIDNLSDKIKEKLKNYGINDLA